MNNLVITSFSDLCVVRHDPEWTDISNPLGEIVREIHFVLAEAPDGRRWVGPVIGQRDQDNVERAIALAEFAYRRCGLEIESAWRPYFPVYGSRAFVDSGQEELDVWCERNDQPYAVASGVL